MTYAKLDQNLLTSSLWTTESKETKLVWITMLAMKDKDGVVASTVPGLARMAGVTIEEAELAIERFLAPDKYSRTTKHDGRRVEEVSEGWLVLNHFRYRESREDREKQRKQEWYDREKRAALECAKVRDSALKSRISAHTDTDTDTDTDTEAKKREQRAANSSRMDGWFDAFWAVAHRKVGKQAARKAFGLSGDRVCQDRDWTQDQAAAFLTDRMKAFAASPQARDDITGKIHPSTWLNEGRYDDDESTWHETRSPSNGKRVPIRSGAGMVYDPNHNPTEF